VHVGSCFSLRRSVDLPTCSPAPSFAVPPRSRTRSCDHAPDASQAPSSRSELALPLDTTVWDATSSADTPHVQTHPRRRWTDLARPSQVDDDASTSSRARPKQDGSKGERDADADGRGVRASGRVGCHPMTVRARPPMDVRASRGRRWKTVRSVDCCVSNHVEKKWIVSFISEPSIQLTNAFAMVVPSQAARCATNHTRNRTIKRTHRRVACACLQLNGREWKRNRVASLLRGP